MKVYIVVAGYGLDSLPDPFHNQWIQKVFGTKEKAEAYVKQAKADNEICGDNFDWIRIEIYEVR